MGIIGAGASGVSLAALSFQAGCRTVLVDADNALLDQARSISSRGLSEADGSDTMSLTLSEDFGSLNDCDILIDTEIGNQDMKEQLVRRLDTVAGQGAVVAINATGMSIDEIAAASMRPEDILGMNFLSPGEGRALLEVVAGQQSASETVATALVLARLLGIQLVQSAHSSGSISEYIASACQAEYEALLGDGALPHEIDAALGRFGFAKEALARSESGRFSRIADEEIVRRMLDAIELAAKRAITNGVAACEGDVDVVAVNGFGYP